MFVERAFPPLSRPSHSLIHLHSNILALPEYVLLASSNSFSFPLGLIKKTQERFVKHTPPGDTVITLILLHGTNSR